MRNQKLGALLCALFVTSAVACGGSDADPPTGGDPNGTPSEDAGTGDGGDGGSGGSGGDGGEVETPGIEVADQAVRVPLHGSIEITIGVERFGGVEGEITVSIEGDLPKGVTMSATTLTIAEGSSQGTLTFSSNDEVEALFEITSLKLVAKAGELTSEATLDVEVAPLVTTLDDGGPGSLRDMIASAPLLAENPTIGFAPAVFTDSGSPHVIELSSELVVEKGLRIEAALVNDEERVFLDAKGTGRVLFIEPTEAGQRVELVGLAIAGGVTDENGGCIRSNDVHLVLEEVTVANCKGKEGGGLYAHLGKVDIVRSRFMDNEATENSGAAFISAVTTVDDSVFGWNRAGASGGALVLRDALEMKKAYFVDNVAQDIGGALRLHAPAQITETRFETNRAASGGAVSVIAKTKIEKSEFLDNSALQEMGGAIRLHGGQELVIEGSRFAGNKGQTGGAIATSPGSKLHVSGGTFAGNKGDDGAGLYVDGGEVRIESSTLDGNTATNEGGAMFFTQDSFGDIFQTTISDNFAYGAGGIYASESSLRIALTTIAMNRVTARGAGVDLYDSQMEMDFSTIVANHSTNGAGGIEASGASVLSPRGSILSNNTGSSANLWVTAGVSVSSRGYNLLGDLTGSNRTCANWHAADLCEEDGIDPELGSLADNGGPTKTVLPLPGSPAIDAVPDDHCKLAEGDQALTVDQRGLPRPTGSGCDIGAVEVQ